jgi:hypothetical protein
MSNILLLLNKLINIFVFTKNKKNGGKPVKDNKSPKYNILNLENLLINKFK